MLKTMRMSKWVLGCVLVAAGFLAGQAPPFAGAQQKPPAANDLDKNIVAHVNGVAVTRQELAEELLARKGRQQLELLINRKIIEQAAQKAGITATDAEVDEDIRQVMKGANCSTATEFEKKVLKKQGTNLYEYREDVVRPGILMRKLGGKRIDITEQELRQAFEAKHGETVECRIILYPDRLPLQKIHEELQAAQASTQKDTVAQVFSTHAKAQPDQNLAAAAGKINPISRFNSPEPYKRLEERAFAIKDGEFTEILQVPEGYLILLREKLKAPEKAVKFEDEIEALRREATEKKMRAEVPKIFRELRDQAAVRDYLNNKYDIKEVMESYRGNVK